VNTAVKWMGIVVAIGIGLMVLEYQFAKKKKEGYTGTDRHRIIGIFWVTVCLALLIGSIIWLSPDD
jgi:hypothetical protein